MTKLLNIKAELQAALLEIKAYEEKKTKASSARIRKYLGTIKKSVTGVRAALIAADKLQ